MERASASKTSLSGEGEEGKPASKTNLSEEREEGGPASKTSLSGEHDSQTKAKSSLQQERPDSPVPSCVPMKSDNSMRLPGSFKGGLTTEPREHQERPEFPSGQSVQGHRTDLASIFTLLAENMMTFVKKELKRFQKILSSDYPECLDSQRKDEEEEQGSSAREGALKITLHFLRNMMQQELADTLENLFLDTPAVLCQRLIKTNLKKKFECVFEGIAKEGNSTLLNQIYTDAYMTEGGSGEVNTQHEVRQIETASRKPMRPETQIRVNYIFKGPPGTVKPIRTVLTKGVAGIGKTVATQRFTLDWANREANQNIQFPLPLSFRELNLLKGMKCSCMELLYIFFEEIKDLGVTNLKKYKVVFIFDGLDECRLPLDFQNNEICTDVTKSTSVDVLLTSLIKGDLLPSAQLWITTRPAAANKIPPECVCLVTEVRGFTDPQKDMYFTKRFSGKENMIRGIISHVKRSRSLHIMCHIPVFCCITATVLEHMFTTDQRGELPKTLTEMYIHFLVFQSKQGNVKYNWRAEADSHWNTESKKIILSLGKLAFQQLKKGNLIFYESDLTECGIDVRAASVCSGVFTQIFREERGLYQSNYCQITEEGCASLASALSSNPFHLRELDLSNNALKNSGVKLLLSGCVVTEAGCYFLASALSSNPSHLRELNLSNNNLQDSGVKLLSDELRRTTCKLETLRLSGCMVTDAGCAFLASALSSNPSHLRELDLSKNNLQNSGVKLLSDEISRTNCKLETLRLSGCMVTEAGCASLASALSSNPSHLRELNLSNNNLQDSGVKLLSDELSRTTCKLEALRLSGCMVTEEGCASLASALRSNPSNLRELDLSYNHPGDSGMKLMNALLDDTHCSLKTLK
ncbi:LOW QUALITY PROTEIN: uncharacterized protein FYW47_012868 [Aplochiton taeniatus]